MSELNKAIAFYDKHFEELWHRIFTEYRAEDDRVWLAGPSSYVFSICGTKFAVDLQIRRKSDMEKVRSGLKEELSDLSFVLITHSHDDHMCIPLMRELADTDIKWIIPYGIDDELIRESDLKEENLLRSHPGDGWLIDSLNITAFESPHLRPEERDSVLIQQGYFIKTPRGNILLPGDVRNYGYKGYPDFGGVSLCFSHLWCGDDALDPKKYMPMLVKYADFFAAFRAKKYFLTHLYEIGRQERYMWHNGHASLAAEELGRRLPDCTVTVPGLGCSYPIFD